jgi:hypothetical protein
MNIIIKTIPPTEMREGVDGADWYVDAAGDLQVRICPMSDPRMEMALKLHEAFEAILCLHDGVTVKQVDEFDRQYDLDHPDETDCEAGDDPEAPYAKQHSLATAVERIYTAHVGLNWRLYDDELNETYPGPSHKT